MKPWKTYMTSLAQTSSHVIKRERSRQSVRERQARLMNRMMGIDCMLADLEMEIQRLRDERVHLRLVREGLTDELSAESRHKLVLQTGRHRPLIAHRHPGSLEIKRTGRREIGHPGPREETYD